MTDIDKICRELAEQICDNIADYSDFPSMRKNDIELIYNAIRDHTVVSEMIEGFQLISNKHGNLPLDNIEKVNGINDGKDRAIKLRACIEIARNLLAKIRGEG